MRFSKYAATVSSAAVIASSLLGAPVFAQETTNSATPTPAPTVVAKPTIDLACMAAAVDKRETVVAAAYDVMTAAAKSALNARKATLAAAWTKTDKKERREAIKTAWDTSKKSVREAKKAWNTARRAAWATFRTEAKVCKPHSSEMEGVGQGIDATL